MDEKINSKRKIRKFEGRNEEFNEEFDGEDLDESLQKIKTHRRRPNIRRNRIN